MQAAARVFESSADLRYNAGSMLTELIHKVHGNGLSALGWLVQHHPGWDDPDMFMPPEPEPAFGIGTLLGMMLLGLAFNCLLGWWGKSRAEDHGVNPWVGFMLGFFLGFIGVAIVPVFRTDRIINTRNPRPIVNPGQPNPMYAPPPQAYGPPQGYGPPPQGYGAPPGPQPHVMQPGYAPPPPLPAPSVEMLVADEFGYVECPACGARTKSGRKSCMTCGNMLPPVYDPNIK